MKIVIAADSFKGSLSSAGVVSALAEGIRNVMPSADIVCIPIADGGEGTVDAFLHSVGGEKLYRTVTGPLGAEVSAGYGILKDGTAVIEMASASGLTLLTPEERDPMLTTTYGTGELVRDALDHGCRNFIIGIGGSATNDGGAGFAGALGIRFLDKNGNDLKRGGAALAELMHIDVSHVDPRLAESRFLVACDVQNPLCGKEGASAVFGPQKGADPGKVRFLDKALRNYAGVIRADLGIDVADNPGAGAAGGLGAGLMAFCGARMAPGIEILLDASHFDDAVRDAQLVITGEGRIDGQSVFGKVPCGVTTRTKKIGSIPVIAVVGCIGPGAEKNYAYGLDAIIKLSNDHMTVRESMEHAAELLRKAGQDIAADRRLTGRAG